MMGVPTYYNRLVNEVEFKSDSYNKMRLFISGSAPLTEKTFNEFKEKTNHSILERYGMTETGMITSNPLHGNRLEGTVGFPLPKVSIRAMKAGKILADNEKGVIEVKGPNGFRDFISSKEVEISLNHNEIVVKPRNLTKKSRQHWGMNRTQIANLIKGVTTGFTKYLELNGVGYRAAIQGNTLKLSLGYSHEIDFAVPESVKITVPKPTEIIVNGIDSRL